MSRPDGAFQSKWTLGLQLGVLCRRTFSSARNTSTHFVADAAAGIRAKYTIAGSHQRGYRRRITSGLVKNSGLRAAADSRRALESARSVAQAAATALMILIVV